MENIVNVEEVKREFISIYNALVKREGAKALLEWMENADFFEAPASSKFHLDCPGGLCQHSLNVYHNLKRLVDIERQVHPELKITDESVAICGLLHDLCKVNFYKIEMRNVKNQDTGKWESVPYYTTDEKFPMGHGEKSVIIAMQFMKLTGDEMMAINWHMGGFDERVKGGASKSISAAYEKSPLAVLLQAADFISSYIDETRG